MWSTNPLLFREKHRTAEIPPYCVLLCWGGVFGVTVSLLLLPHLDVVFLSCVVEKQFI